MGRRPVGSVWEGEDRPLRLVTTTIDGDEVEPLLDVPPALSLDGFDVAAALVDLDVLARVDLTA